MGKKKVERKVDDAWNAWKTAIRKRRAACGIATKKHEEVEALRRCLNEADAEFCELDERVSRAWDKICAAEKRYIYASRKLQRMLRPDRDTKAP